MNFKNEKSYCLEGKSVICYLCILQLLRIITLKLYWNVNPKESVLTVTIKKTPQRLLVFCVLNVENVIKNQ